VLLYTDGLTEARRDGKQFGLDGVRAALGGLRKPALTEAVAILRARVAEFAYGTLTERSLPARRPHRLLAAHSGVQGGREPPNGHSNARRRTVDSGGRPHFGGSALASCERSEDGPAVTSVSLSVGVGLICALLSALGTNLAFLFKHRGAIAAPDVDIRHPLRSAVDLFRSKWWSIGWGVAAVAFALHVAALTLAPISIGQAVLAGVSSSSRCSPSASSASSSAVASGSGSAWSRSH
jgi:hypothetical protein